MSGSSKMPSNSVSPQRSFTADVLVGRATLNFPIRVNVSSFSDVVIIHFPSLKDAFEGPKTCTPLSFNWTVSSRTWSEFVSGGFQQSRWKIS